MGEDAGFFDGRGALALGGEQGLEVGDVVVGKFFADEAGVAVGGEAFDVFDRGAGVEGKLELADEVGEEIGGGGELGGGGIGEGGGGGIQMGGEAGREERGVAGGGAVGEGPIGGRGAGDGVLVEGGEVAGVGGEVEVGAGEGGGVLAEGGAEGGGGEETLAGVGDFVGAAGGEEDGVEVGAEEGREIGGREDDGFAGGEELGEFRREAVVVEGAGMAGLDEDVGEGEEVGEAGLGDEAEVEDVGLDVGGEAGEELGGIEAGAEEAGGGAALVEEGDGEVEFAHLGLVGEGVGAGEDDDAFGGREAEFGAEGGGGGGGRGGGVEGEIDAGEEEVGGRAGGGELAEAFDDVRDAVGDAEEGFVAERVGQGVDEPGVDLGGGGGAEGGEGFAGVGFEEEALVVFEVDQEAGGGGTEQEGGALVGDGEFADAFARGPGVDEFGGFAVGEETGAGEEFGVGGGDEEGRGDVRDGLLVLGDSDDTGVAGGAEGVRETTDVVQAVGGKVAVIDEEDVHAVVRVERKRKGRLATLRGSAPEVNADFRRNETKPKWRWGNRRSGRRGQSLKPAAVESARNILTVSRESPARSRPTILAAFARMS